jgi:hypothetical protein
MKLAFIAVNHRKPALQIQSYDNGLAKGFFEQTGQFLRHMVEFHGLKLGLTLRPRDMSCWTRVAPRPTVSSITATPSEILAGLLPSKRISVA